MSTAVDEGGRVMMAIWVDDFEPWMEELYKRPACPECQEWIKKDEEGKYRCRICGRYYAPRDEKMREWLEKADETKVEWEDDHEIITDSGFRLGCNGKKCVETHYVRNQATLEWRISWGYCLNCGKRFMT